MKWDWDIARQAMPYLVDGIYVTAATTAGGMALALVIGLLFAMGRRSPQPIIAWMFAGVIEFIRCTPLLIQLFLAYYIVPDFGWNGPIVTGVLVLGLHYGTYVSEAYRAGIDAVAQGQWDAAIALNLPRHVVWTRVVLPQAIPPAIPAIGNYWIAMFKDTPLLYAITVREMLSQATNFSSRAGSYVETYTLVGMLFLIMSLGASQLVRWGERVFKRRES